MQFCLEHETYKNFVEVRGERDAPQLKYLYVDGKRVLDSMTEVEAFELKSRIDLMCKQLVSDLISCFSKPEENLYFKAFGRSMTDDFWVENPGTSN